MAAVGDIVPEIMDTIKCLLKGLSDSQKSKYNEPKDISKRMAKNQSSILTYIMFYLNLECEGMPSENQSECKILSAADKWNALAPKLKERVEREDKYFEDMGFRGGKIEVGREKPIFSCLIQAILEKSFKEGDLIIHNGRQIVRLPDSKELVLRLVSPMLANAMSSFNNKGNTISTVSDAVFWTAVGDTYRHVLSHKRDLYCDALGLNADVYTKIFELWDEQVGLIRDKLASVGRNANPVIPDKNIITKTEYSPNSTDTKYKESKHIFMNRPSNTPGIRLLRPIAPISVRVEAPVVRTFAGGNAQANLHAPLYPTIVMNGGAHPLATLTGGAKQYVGTLAQGPMLDRLIQQFEKIAGTSPSKNATVAQIKMYRTKVENAAKKLQEQIDILQNANLALARAPLGAGFDVENFTPEQLKNLAKRGEEINKASERLFKQTNTLQDIGELMQEVIDRHTPVVNL